MIWHLLIIFTAFAGFLLAFYIRHKKGAGETFVCPIGADCNMVIHSEYSKFFGIPVEVLGLLYYALVALVYALFLASPVLTHPVVIITVYATTAASFIFSLYLTFVQAFKLKEWCTWCLTSAALCSVIFLATFLATPLEQTGL